nr:hypothetical protein BCU06_11750 [Vibrio breoganii]
MFILKRQQYSIVRNHSLGCFSQGVLSQKSFGRVGIDKRKISDLFYTPAPLVPLPADQDIVNFANGRSVFLCVSALCVRKGIDILIKAFSKLQTHDWVLVLVGVDKNNGYYQRLCRELGIQHLVFFAGKREVREIASVYTASDVFVLPTRFDGWGAVLNEAASLGLPLISTDMCGGAWHLIEHNVNGYRVRADSVSALLEALEKYVKNRDAIIIHSSKTKEIYFDNFLPQHNVKRLLAGIEKFKGNRIKND